MLNPATPESLTQPSPSRNWPTMTPAKQHFPRVALVIEGGGTRNSYTAPLLECFLAHGISFGWVGGISAGASHTVNFLSGDARRVREAFVDTPAAKEAGG